jgi:DNA-binding SARP family transcriptional activator
VGIEIGVLGAIEARHGEAGAVHPVDLGWRRQRSLLSLLVIARGAVVPVDRIVDSLWEGSPPTGAVASLQAQVSRLRRALEPARAPRGRAQVLVTRPPGYALVLAPDVVDAWRFESMVNAAATRTDPISSRRLLERALGLWRGPAYAEFAGRPWALPEAARLDDLRGAAHERLVEALLTLGDRSLATSAAEELVAAHPRREAGWRLLATALYADGRQADALAALRRARDYLREHVGLDPGPVLQQLERDILSQEVVTPRPLITASSGAPRQDFVGRRTELSALAEAARYAAGGRVTTVALVSGDPGVGKSTLLQRFGDELAGSGWTVVSARCPETDGAAPLAAWGQIVRAITADGTPVAAALGRLVTRDGRIERDGDVSAARVDVRTALTQLLSRAASGRPLALLIDDVHCADQETMRLLAGVVEDLVGVSVLIVAATRPAWPGADEPGAAVALAKAVSIHIELTGFDRAEAGQIIAAASGSELDDEVVDALIERTGGNAFFLTEIGRLARSQGSLSATTRVPDGVRAVLRRRFALLPGRTVDLLRLGAVIGRDVDLELLILVAATACDVHDADEIIAAIEAGLREGLFVEPRPGLVRFSHLVVRDTLYDDVTKVRRSQWHAAIAAALGELSPGDVAARAHHLYRSGTSAGAREAVDTATPAAEQALAGFAPERAIELIEWALRAIEQLDARGGSASADERSHLLSLRSRAELAVGAGVAALATRTEALRAAERSGDPEVLVRALTAWDLPTLWTTRSYGTVDTWLVGLLERALRASHVDAATRVRLLCALARELAGLDQDRAHRAADEAEHLARHLADDAVASGLALHSQGVVLLHDSDLVGRLRLAEELIALGERPGLASFALLGHEFVVQWAVAHAQRSPLVEHLSQMDALVATYGWRQAAAVVATHHGVLAHLTGDIVAAEHHYRIATDELRRAGGLDVDEIATIVAFSLAVTGGDTSALAPLLDAAGTVPAPMADLAAVVLADARRLDEARAVWATREPIGHDFFRSLKLTGRALAVVRLGAVDEAAEVDAALAEFSGQLAGAVTGAFAFLPVDALRGDLARLLGRHTEAAAHDAAAAAVADRCGSAVWKAAIAARRSLTESSR